MHRLDVMLTEIEKQILRMVQEPLPLCEQPFAAMAHRLGCPPERLIATIRNLKKTGLIRRYGAIVNYAALSRTATLVAASVPQEKLNELITAVNSLAGVSHHYLRKHLFNLWFTLQGASPQEIENTLCQLNRQTNVRFYSLPAVRVFKLDVRFRPEGPLQEDFERMGFLPPENPAAVVSLTEMEKKSLRFLQEDFPIMERPFEAMRQKSGIANIEEFAGGLVAKGVVHRIAAILNHCKLGYQANGMACFALPQGKIESVARALAARPAVSHCYQRETFAGWPYNLFAMIHAGRIEDVERFVSSLAEEYGISEWVLLPTEKELKKQPVLYDGQ